MVTVTRYVTALVVLGLGLPATAGAAPEAGPAPVLVPAEPAPEPVATPAVTPADETAAPTTEAAPAEPTPVPVSVTQPQPEPAPPVVAPEPAPTPTVAAEPDPARDPEPAPQPEVATEVATEAPVEAPATDDAPTRPRFPRLVLAGGPFIGPHALGNEECRLDAMRCDKRGSFFGLGLQVELRARIYKPLYVHARGLIARNVSPNDRVYRGLGGGAAGLGAYGRRVFGRAEMLLVGAYGDNAFTPPFHATESGRDEWGNVAGLLAAGFRQPFAERIGLELWGGVMFGPKSVRTIPSAEPDERTLTTFMVGLNFFADVVQ